MKQSPPLPKVVPFRRLQQAAKRVAKIVTDIESDRRKSEAAGKAVDKARADLADAQDQAARDMKAARDKFESDAALMGNRAGKTYDRTKAEVEARLAKKRAAVADAEGKKKKADADMAEDEKELRKAQAEYSDLYKQCFP